MTANLVTVYINDIEVKVLENSTVLQACEKLGIKVPRFCYHEKLSIAGNCRMCLVEIKNAPKLQASCALPVMKDSRIYTDSIAVRKAREGIMELLLINHPLDCPICDQGGECDLQDQAMYYGSDHGRFNEYKRATSDKNFGPLIKTIMTRCIHCTRCVRFASEIAGCPELGTIGRGNNIEISTFVRSWKSTGQSLSDESSSDQSVLDSELSGNLIDICPVGALTSLPYAFVARPWELKSIMSVDISDTYCSDIKVDIRGQGPGSILRILPAHGSNSTWISDKTRFSYDGLKRQRLLTPCAKDGLILDSEQNINSKTKSFELKTWDEVLGLKTLFTAGSNLTLFLGNNIDLETLKVLKSIQTEGKVNLNLIFIHPDSNRYSNNIKTKSSTDYISSKGSYEFKFFTETESKANSALTSLSTTFVTEKDLEKSDLCLLVGTNPRLESPVLNACLQKVAKKGKVFLFGSNSDKLPYPVKHLGHSVSSLLSFVNSSKHINKILEGSSKEKRVLLVGSAIFYRPDALEILTALNTFVKEYNFGTLKVLYQSVSELNGLYTGLNVLDTYDSKTLDKIKESNFFIYYNLPSYALNNPLIKLSFQESLNKQESSKTVSIYVGSHGNTLTNKCTWILPVTAFTEKTSSYLSNTGKIKHTTMVTYPPGVAIQDNLLFSKLFTTGI